MGSVNKVILVGNLGADPELKYTPAGKAVCNFSIATTESWKDKGGEKQEKTEWHRLVVWGEVGENCSKYLAKGRACYVEGRLQTRSYEKDGQKHFMTEIVADKVVFLGGGERSEGSGEDKPRGRTSAPPAGGRGRSSNAPKPPATEPEDGDIPF